MTKDTQVKWNGAKEDPDSIVQYGVELNKGEWTTLPENLDEQYVRRFHKASAVFEIKGEDKAPPLANDAGPQSAAPVHAALHPYKVQKVTNAKGKTLHFIIVSENGAPVPNGDEYADEESAQTVADGMNKVAP